MLPWPGRHWAPVPCAEPGTTSIKCPARWRGRDYLITITASDGQVEIEPTPDVKLEIPLEVWMQIAPLLTAMALKVTTRDLPPPG